MATTALDAQLAALERTGGGSSALCHFTPAIYHSRSLPGNRDKARQIGAISRGLLRLTVEKARGVDVQLPRRILGAQKTRDVDKYQVAVLFVEAYDLALHLSTRPNNAANVTQALREWVSGTASAAGERLPRLKKLFLVLAGTNGHSLDTASLHWKNAQPWTVPRRVQSRGAMSGSSFSVQPFSVPINLDSLRNLHHASVQVYSDLMRKVSDEAELCGDFLLTAVGTGEDDLSAGLSRLSIRSQTNDGEEPTTGDNSDIVMGDIAALARSLSTPAARKENAIALLSHQMTKFADYAKASYSIDPFAFFWMHPEVAQMSPNQVMRVGVVFETKVGTVKGGWWSRSDITPFGVHRDFLDAYYMRMQAAKGIQIPEKAGLDTLETAAACNEYWSKLDLDANALFSFIEIRDRADKDKTTWRSEFVDSSVSLWLPIVFNKETSVVYNMMTRPATDLYTSMAHRGMAPSLTTLMVRLSDVSLVYALNDHNPNPTDSDETDPPVQHMCYGFQFELQSTYSDTRVRYTCMRESTQEGQLAQRWLTHEIDSSETREFNLTTDSKKMQNLSRSEDRQYGNWTTAPGERRDTVFRTHTGTIIKVLSELFDSEGISLLGSSGSLPPATLKKLGYKLPVLPSEYVPLKKKGSMRGDVTLNRIIDLTNPLTMEQFPGASDEAELKQMELDERGIFLIGDDDDDDDDGANSDDEGLNEQFEQTLASLKERQLKLSIKLGYVADEAAKKSNAKAVKKEPKVKQEQVDGGVIIKREPGILQDNMEVVKEEPVDTAGPVMTDEEELEARIEFDKISAQIAAEEAALDQATRLQNDLTGQVSQQHVVAVRLYFEEKFDSNKKKKSVAAASTSKKKGQTKPPDMVKEEPKSAQPAAVVKVLTFHIPEIQFCPTGSSVWDPSAEVNRFSSLVPDSFASEPDFMAQLAIAARDYESTDTDNDGTDVTRRVVVINPTPTVNLMPVALSDTSREESLRQCVREHKGPPGVVQADGRIDSEFLSFWKTLASEQKQESLRNQDTPAQIDNFWSATGPFDSSASKQFAFLSTSEAKLAKETRIATFGDLGTSTDAAYLTECCALYRLAPPVAGERISDLVNRILEERKKSMAELGQKRLNEETELRNNVLARVHPSSTPYDGAFVPAKSIPLVSYEEVHVRNGMKGDAELGVKGSQLVAATTFRFHEAFAVPFSSLRWCIYPGEGEYFVGVSEKEQCYLVRRLSYKAALSMFSTMAEQERQAMAKKNEFYMVPCGFDSLVAEIPTWTCPTDIETFTDARYKTAARENNQTIFACPLPTRTEFGLQLAGHERTRVHALGNPTIQRTYGQELSDLVHWIVSFAHNYYGQCGLEIDCRDMDSACIFGEHVVPANGTGPVPVISRLRNFSGNFKFRTVVPSAAANRDQIVPIENVIERLSDREADIAFYTTAVAKPKNVVLKEKARNELQKRDAMFRAAYESRTTVLIDVPTFVEDAVAGVYDMWTERAFTSRYGTGATDGYVPHTTCSTVSIRGGLRRNLAATLLKTQAPTSHLPAMPEPKGWVFPRGYVTDTSTTADRPKSLFPHITFYRPVRTVVTVDDELSWNFFWKKYLQDSQINQLHGTTYSLLDGKITDLQKRGLDDRENVSLFCKSETFLTFLFQLPTLPHPEEAPVGSVDYLQREYRVAHSALSTDVSSYYKPLSAAEKAELAAKEKAKKAKESQMDKRMDVDEKKPRSEPLGRPRVLEKAVSVGTLFRWEPSTENTGSPVDETAPLLNCRVPRSFAHQIVAKEQFPFELQTAEMQSVRTPSEFLDGLIHYTEAYMFYMDLAELYFTFMSSSTITDRFWLPFVLAVKKERRERYDKANSKKRSNKADEKKRPKAKETPYTLAFLCDVLTAKPDSDEYLEAEWRDTEAFLRYMPIYYGHQHDVHMKSTPFLIMYMFAFMATALDEKQTSLNSALIQAVTRLVAEHYQLDPDDLGSLKLRLVDDWQKAGKYFLAHQTACRLGANVVQDAFGAVSTSVFYHDPSQGAGFNPALNSIISNWLPAMQTIELAPLVDRLCETVVEYASNFGSQIVFEDPATFVDHFADGSFTSEFARNVVRTVHNEFHRQAGWSELLNDYEEVRHPDEDEIIGAADIKLPEERGDDADDFDPDLPPQFSGRTRPMRRAAQLADNDIKNFQKSGQSNQKALNGDDEDDDDSYGQSSESSDDNDEEEEDDDEMSEDDE